MRESTWKRAQGGARRAIDAASRGSRMRDPRRGAALASHNATSERHRDHRRHLRLPASRQAAGDPLAELAVLRERSHRSVGRHPFVGRGRPRCGGLVDVIVDDFDPRQRVKKNRGTGVIRGPFRTTPETESPQLGLSHRRRRWACTDQRRWPACEKKAGGTDMARGPFRAISRTESPQLGLSHRKRRRALGGRRGRARTSDAGRRARKKPAGRIWQGAHSEPYPRPSHHNSACPTGDERVRAGSRARARSRRASG